MVLQTIGTPVLDTSRILTEMVSRLSTTITLDEITSVITHAVRRVIGCDGTTFVLREDGNCFYVDEDAIGPLWKGSRFPLENCLSGWAMINKRPTVIPDITLDPRVPQDAYQPTFVKSMAMVPIRSSDPLGAIGAYWGSNHTATPEEVRMLEVIANSAAVALDNLELRGEVQRRADERDELESVMHTLVHDLRSPLGAMMGFAELLATEMEDPETTQAFAQTILASGRRMAEQIDEMLALYRIVNRPLNPSNVDLTEIAHEIVDSLCHQTPERRVTFLIADDLTAHVDPVLARVLLENLLGNAFKYTGKTTDAIVEFTRSEDGVGLCVRDNGDGFDQTAAAKLFHPMQRLHTEAEFPGTGLGLASAARIVSSHGGEITASGIKGEGATFTFWLPTAA